MSLAGNKEEYWKVRSASQKLWDEAEGVFRKKYAKEIKVSADLQKQEDDDYKDVIYECVYALRPGQDVSEEDERGSYLDTWPRSDYFNMPVWDEDQPDAPLPGRPITVHLQPTPFRCRPISFFSRCVICGREATPEGKFLCCTQHKDRKITVDLLVDVMRKYLEQCIEMQKEALTQEPKPEKEIVVECYRRPGDSEESKIYIDLISSKIVSEKALEKKIYGDLYVDEDEEEGEEGEGEVEEGGGKEEIVLKLKPKTPEVKPKTQEKKSQKK